jgi:serine/threonine protein kinase
MHRDLKPSNIIYDSESGKAVLLDLGFAIYFHKND